MCKCCFCGKEIEVEFPSPPTFEEAGFRICDKCKEEWEEEE